MSGSTAKVPIKSLDTFPLVRALNRQMKSALEAFSPRHVAVQLLENYCAGPGGANISEPGLRSAAEISDDSAISAVLFAAAGPDGDLDLLEPALPAGLAGAVSLLQTHSTSRIHISARALQTPDWDKMINEPQNFLFTRWRLGSGTTATEMLQAIPDSFFLALADRMFEPGRIRRMPGMDPRAFLEFLARIETAVGQEFPDGVPGMDFHTSWLFMGGQCAEVKWHLHLADLFALPPADLQTLERETRKHNMYETFLLACSGCMPTAAAALARVFSSRGIQEFREKVAKISESTTAAARSNAEFRILELALDLFHEEQVTPPPALRLKLEQTLEDHYAPGLFDKKRARNDFTNLMLSMPAPDLQYALSHLPRHLIARALAIEPDMGLFRLHREVKSNTAAGFYKTLTEEMRRPAPGKADLLSPTMARLQCIDTIHNFAARDKISTAIYAHDKDWLPPGKINDILKNNETDTV